MEESDCGNLQSDFLLCRIELEVRPQMRQVRQASSRYGVTIVEVLIVCGIIALLAAILVPAVQAVRNVARKMDCSSRMKQVGVAVHSYHGTHGCLPPSSGSTGWGDTSVWYFLLADLGMNDLRMKIADIEAEITRTGGFTGTTPDLLYRARVLRCPSSGEQHQHGINFGVNWAGDGIRKLVDGMSVGAPNGVFIYVRQPPVSFSSIVDGTSNTAMASEFVRGPGSPDVLLPGRPVDRTIPKGMIFNLLPGATNPLDVDLYLSRCNGVNSQSDPVVADDRGTFWLGSDYWNYTYTHYSTPNSNSCIEPSRLAIIISAGSSHAGGVNVLFADGSVRFIANSVDITAWRAAGTRNGGESQSAL